MKILVLSGGYPTTKDPLLGIFEFDQAKALKDYGHEVIFVSIDLRSIRRKRKWGKYWTKKEGVDILNCSIPIGNLPYSFLLFVGKRALNYIYKDILKKLGKPDLIHSHFTIIGNISIIMKKKYNIPVVVTEHNSEVNKKHISNSLYIIGEETYSNADKLLAVSSALANNMKNHWELNAQVISNIVDTSIFTYSLIEKQKKFIFLSIGNLTYNKGFDLLINAFSAANFENYVELKIVGGGSLHDKLQQQIDDLKLSDQIHLLGQLSRNEIGYLMKQCNAFVLASRSETFGVVYIEAMAAGLPVIATACGGPEDFVNSQNGILIPPEDEKSLTEALVKIYNNIESFDPLFISESTKFRFSPQNIASQLTEIYENLLKNKNTHS